MIVDFDKADLLPVKYDVCIAGAGIAGITLAVLLEKKRVLLLEAGGKNFSEISQSLYKGQIIGHEYFDLDTARLRFLGGTSNHWAGWCRYLDPHDFERRSHIEGSGWPIDFEDVDAYLPVALKILEIDPFASNRVLEGSDGMFEEFDLRVNAINFKDKYTDLLDKSDKIDVLLNANVVDIILNTENGRVATFDVRGYSGKSLQVNADNFVLAMGGIENARALLNANKQLPSGIGNENDLVGRYFMEHLVFTLGYYTVDSTSTNIGTDEREFIAPSPAFQERSQIANCGLRLLKVVAAAKEQGLLGSVKSLSKETICESAILIDLLRSIRWFRCPPPFDRAGLVRAASEQVPNPHSRVLLNQEIDLFGLRQVSLDWRLTPLDKETLRESMLGLAEFFATQNIGRVKIDPWLLDKDVGFPPKEADELAGYHHMGTTRMARSQKEGVVDENCRVFDVANLFIAGSSVFSTGGHANPTLPIVQLTARLADHLTTA